MQYAKDSFYIALRDRLAVLNALRTVVVRGVARPGILVEENEVTLPQMISDIFILRWTDLQSQSALPGNPTQAVCEIHYQTSGTAPTGGMDRGRSMAQMDAELRSILSPPRASKLNYTVSPPTQMASSIFWSDAEWGPVTKTRDQLARVAKVTVHSYQEPGEL